MTKLRSHSSITYYDFIFFLIKYFQSVSLILLLYNQSKNAVLVMALSAQHNHNIISHSYRPFNNVKI